MARGKFTPFTEVEKQKIKDEYLDKPVKRLADELGFSFGRVKRFLDKNNLVIPKEIVEQRKRMNRFKKGHTPFNRGKKQSEYMKLEAIEQSKATRFKKGHKPHNTKYDGVISLRPDKSGRTYKYIRISEGVWELYHRSVWERVNGKIPEGHLIAFKDGNSLNTRLDNLEVISMTENMYRNSVHDYPEEVIPSMVLIKQLDNKLKDIKDE